MIKTKLTYVKEPEICEKICDVCGRIEAKEKDGEHNWDFERFCHIRKGGGYASTFPKDCQIAECDICEDCLERLMGKYFRIRDDHQALVQAFGIIT